jgi:Tol biopolymer transport system component/tRNA A-37 threonylcarbamoyl transferase component Bud32
MDALGQLNRTLTGRYVIEREIGRGGMATVYLARDVKHNRRVALKVLNPELGAVLGVERFLAEIEVTANLQHPNLLPLFDSGEAEGLLYYVMPYIEGESLRAKLSREKQLPIDEALHIATAVASAVDYAHRHGVIHRDLKPENILLHEGQPLVADFGIALAVSKAGGERVTQTGLSLGTPQYMSPEQATGDRTIDGRTDIYSLGAMLYEMLTGDPPHTASTAQAIIARVITDTPRPVSASRPHVPPHVDVAVACALEKLPADRWHTAHEFADALAGREGVAAPSGVRVPGTTGLRVGKGNARRRVVAIGAAAFLAGVVLAALASWGFLAKSRDARGSSVTFVIDPPSGGSLGTFAVSPDGETVAFVASVDTSTKLYLRHLSELVPQSVPGTDGAYYGTFSPDGNWLVVGMNDGRVLRVSTAGRTAPITLAENINVYGEAFWSRDGILLGRVEQGVGMSRVAPTGGAMKQQFKTKSPTWGHGVPLVAQDGKTVLFEDWGPGYTEDDFLAIGSLETGEYERTPLLANRPLGIVDGHIVYSRGGAILAVPFDVRKRRVTGEPVRVMEGLSLYETKGAALSPTGTLVYRRGELMGRLALADTSGRLTPISSEQRIMMFAPPRFSPDGRRIAVVLGTQRTDTLSSDVWIFDVGSLTFSRLTSLGDASSASWTPDGKEVMVIRGYVGARKKPGLWRQSVDGDQPAEKLVDGPEGENLDGGSVTPDGRGLLFCRGKDADPNARTHLSYLPFSAVSTPEPLLDETLGWTCDAHVSPDGKWLAYTASDGPKMNVYVRPFRRPGRRVQVSEGNARLPHWSRDGSRLYYAFGESAEALSSVAAVTLGKDGDQAVVLSRERVGRIPGHGLYDMAPDGKILTLQQSESRVHLVVTTNWFPELRARLTGTK